MTTTTADEQATVRQLLDSPEGRRLTAQREADQLAVRRAKVTTLRQLAADEGKRLAPLREKVAAAAADVAAAHDAMLAAQRCHGEALATESAIRGQIDAERGRLERDLRETAPPEIAAFIREMGDLWERTRRTPISSSGGTPDGRGGFSPVTSNAPAVQARLAAINEARLAAEALLYQALDGTEVAKCLAALRSTIPEAS